MVVGMQFTKNEWLTIVVGVAVNVFVAGCESLQAPFYPSEAEKKGATATEYGFVFGSYELTSFLVSPFIGKIVGNYGAPRLMACGMTLSSIAMILFGLLDNINNRVLFTGLSVILRIAESVGAATALVSGYSLIGTVFRDSVATMFATLELFYGVSLILGPTAGGFLYAYGGYAFPFVTVGVTGVAIAISILILIPSTTESPKNNDNHKMKSAIRVPAIALSAICLIMYTMSLGFYCALLEHHLRQISSLFFVVNSLTYALVTPFAGRVLDKNVNPKTLNIVVCVTLIGSFIIIGPAPFLPFSATILSSIIALILQGLGIGIGVVVTFADMFRSAKDAGFPDASATYGLISGIWFSSQALGGFIGPTIAGILYDLSGFRWATMFVSGSYVILLIAVIIFATLKRDGVDEEETIPILSKN